MSTFDRDTAVERLGDGRFGAEIRPAWSIVRGPNGGYLAAIVLRALCAATADQARTPRSLTIHYLAAPRSGPVELRTRVERAGSRLTTVSARMEQDGATVALALAAFSPSWEQALPDSAPAMPDAPPPDSRPPFPRVPGQTPPFSDHFVMTPAIGAAPFSGGEEARTGGWLRLADPRPVDHVLLATYADAWFPAPFSRLTGPVAAPTIDLTIHFRTSDPAVAAGEPVLTVFTSRTLQDGFWEEDGEIWSADGRLLAQSRQLALLLPPKEVRRVRRIGYLGLGSNVGDRRARLQAAADALPAHGVEVLAASHVYDTQPVGEVLDQPDFLNACLRVATELGPEELLDACKAVERELGREPGGQRHGPRPIDVDVLLLGEQTYRSERLALPHDQVTSRRFVLVPLLELEPGLTTPQGVRAADALAALPDDDQAVREAGPPLEVRA